MIDRDRLAARALNIILTGGEGSAQRASRFLADALASIDPVTAPADRELSRAAQLYAMLVEEPETKLTWARYAEAASRVVYGSDSYPALEAADNYAHILITQGLTFPAVVLLQRVVARYEQLGDSEGIITSRHTLAEAMHADGLCDEAEQQITHLLRPHHIYQPGYSCSYGQIVTTAAAILAGCGRVNDAATLLCREAHRMPWGTSFTLDEAAERIAASEQEHLQVCTRHRTGHRPAQPADPGQRRTGWLHLLDKATSRHQRTTATP